MTMIIMKFLKKTALPLPSLAHVPKKAGMRGGINFC